MNTVIINGRELRGLGKGEASTPAGGTVVQETDDTNTISTVTTTTDPATISEEKTVSQEDINTLYKKTPDKESNMKYILYIGGGLLIGYLLWKFLSKEDEMVF